ncbi:MAG: isochorismatase family protein [Dehalococcoidia bacterium]|nr:isochorismatase family protein [Dehalococcoidia bacterium]
MANGERLDAEATALVVFDMQNGQIHVDDRQRQEWLSNSGIVQNCVSLLAAAREGGVPIYYVRNNRRADGLDSAPVLTDRGMGGGSGGAPPYPGWQWEIIKELEPHPEDIVVDKIRMGAFSSTPLDTLLRARKVDTVVLCGVRTTIGIATTVRDGRDLGYNMVVASDATGGIDPEEHEWMIEKIFPIFGRVRTVSDLQSMLSRSAASA